jgi:hypothetical protein
MRRRNSVGRLPSGGAVAFPSGSSLSERPGRIQARRCETWIAETFPVLLRSHMAVRPANIEARPFARSSNKYRLAFEAFLRVHTHCTVAEHSSIDDVGSQPEACTSIDCWGVLPWPLFATYATIFSRRSGRLSTAHDVLGVNGLGADSWRPAPATARQTKASSPRPRRLCLDALAHDGNIDAADGKGRRPQLLISRLAFRITLVYLQRTNCLVCSHYSTMSMQRSR